MAERFAPKGAVSMRDACLEVFRGLGAGQWVELGDLAHRVEEITGVECPVGSVKGAAWSAREALAFNKECAVGWYMGGYKRLEAPEQVSDVLHL